ncbi:MAG TPA: DUF4845 domain-containing protein [Macromonas sp.]|nr:DUF4845 domain-containing protein [Macromonas sp.]
MKHIQQGFSLIGFLFVASVVALVVVVAAQVLPTVIEFQSISKAAQRAVDNHSSVVDIRKAFDKSASADYFDAIKGSDLEILKDNDKIFVEFSYQKEIHLAGPAYLLMKYHGRTK